MSETKAEYTTGSPFQVIDAFGKTVSTGIWATEGTVYVDRVAGERLYVWEANPGRWVEHGAYAGPGARESQPPPQSAANTLTDYELDAWVASHLFGGLVGHRAYSSIGNEMLLVLETMRRHGYSVFVQATPDHERWHVTIGNASWVEHPSLPRAVAEAVKIALEE